MTIWERGVLWYWNGVVCIRKMGSPWIICCCIVEWLLAYGTMSFLCLVCNGLCCEVPPTCLLAGIGWGVGIFLKLFGEWCLYASLGVFGGTGMPEPLRIRSVRWMGWGRTCFYAIHVGVGPLLYWSLDFKRVLEYVLFVYHVGVSFVYSLYKGCTLLCFLYNIHITYQKKKNYFFKTWIEGSI